MVSPSIDSAQEPKAQAEQRALSRRRQEYVTPRQVRGRASRGMGILTDREECSKEGSGGRLTLSGEVAGMVDRH